MLRSTASIDRMPNRWNDMNPRRTFSQYAAVAVMAVTVAVAGTGASAQARDRGARLTELVDRVGPAVVNIRTTQAMRGMVRGPSGGEPDEDMLEFFRRFGVPIPGRPNPRSPQQPGEEDRVPRGVGSGFILNADGYVMTNAHVVDGADEVIVTLADKREFKAKTIGADKRSDVALVKIEASGLPTVRLGDASKLKVGEWVIAIGSPFGLESTVTAGIVSAKSRDTGDLLPLIQTDVASTPATPAGR